MKLRPVHMRLADCASSGRDVDLSELLKVVEGPQFAGAFGLLSTTGIMGVWLSRQPVVLALCSLAEGDRDVCEQLAARMEELMGAPSEQGQESAQVAALSAYAYVLAGAGDPGRTALEGPARLADRRHGTLSHLIRRCLEDVTTFTWDALPMSRRWPETVTSTGSAAHFAGGRGGPISSTSFEVAHELAPCAPARA
jgi:hypothetical protein